MIRILTIAAAAAAIAAPAAAASQAVKISLTGKSPEQVQAEVQKAAKKVCTAASVGASFPREMYATCYKASVESATAKLGAASTYAVNRE